jgi:hypothetical protein
MGDSTQSESNVSANSATTLGSTGALESLLRENLELSKKIFHQNKKIQRRMTFMAVSDGLRILLIVVPLIIALIYLPPLLKNYKKSPPSLNSRPLISNTSAANRAT